MVRPDDGGLNDQAAGVSEPSAFALSRIQAEGWRAGRQCGAADDAAAAAQADRLNPYKSAIERARWRAGFDAGLLRGGR
jgi:hypothetical protein